MTSSGGLPLDEYNRQTPPGWKPYMSDYPLRLFLEKLKLWYRQFQGDDAEVGVLVAGRLKGGALTTALKLRVPKPNAMGGGFYVGDEALCQPAVQEILDQAGRQIQPPIKSGVQTLVVID